MEQNNMKNRQRISGKFILIGLFLSVIFNTSKAQSVRPVGMNLSFIDDWSQQWVFVDVMKQSRPWIVQKTGYGSTHWDWQDTGIVIPQRSDGYPVQIPYTVSNTSYQVHTLMLRELTHAAPAGTYSLIFEGTGSIQLDFDAQSCICSVPDSLYHLVVTPSSNGIHLTILSSDVNDPIHNIRVIMPGYENTYQTEPYHPRFLELIQPFSVLRYLCPQNINLAETENPSQITPFNYYTQARSGKNNGLAYQYIADISNKTNTNPWICIPHKANDSCIAKIAEIFRDSLEPGRKVYIEYSNEVWNTAYPYGIVTQYASNMGTTMGLSGNSVIAGLNYYVLRSLEIFNIFDSIFSGDTTRFVKVLSTQFLPGTCQTVLSALNNSQVNPSNDRPDAFAVAPYFGHSIADNIGDAGLINTITIQDILDSLEAKLPEVSNRINAIKSLTDSFNLPFITYEGGQHLISNNYANDSVLINKLAQANRDPGMKQIYCDYYDIWYNSGGGLYNIYELVYAYTKYGTFGNLEYMYQDTATAPKWMALLDCILDTTTTYIANDTPNDNNCYIFPNPADREISITNLQVDAKSIVFTDIFGKQILNITVNTNTMKIPINRFNAGLYIYRVLNENQTAIAAGKFVIKKY